jgi:hypothetical protein
MLPAVTRNGTDSPTSDLDEVRRSIMLVLLTAVGLAAALVIVLVLVDPSAGAAGGCGGG